MTPTLRRAHRTIWLALSVALPIGFGAALYGVEQPVAQEAVSAALPTPLPILVRSVDSPVLTVSLLKAVPSTDCQLQIIVKTAFQTPSTVVSVRQQTGWQTIGLLDAPGTYRFQLPGSDAHPQIRIRDDIHQRTLYMLQL